MKFILVMMLCIGDLCGNGFISAPFDDEISCIEYSKLYAEAINQRIAAEDGKGQMACLSEEDFDQARMENGFREMKSLEQISPLK